MGAMDSVLKKDKSSSKDKKPVIKQPPPGRKGSQPVDPNQKSLFSFIQKSPKDEKKK